MKLFLFSIIGLLMATFDRKPYRKLIKQWSSLFHLKVKFHSRYSEHFSVDVIDDVLYISRYNKAMHDPNEYLYSIAHEFGHLIDYAYKEFYYDEDGLYETLTDKEMIYRDEVAAWTIAKVLLQDANVLDNKMFSSLRNRCLGEYRVALKLNIKRTKKSTKKRVKRVKRSKAPK